MNSATMKILILGLLIYNAKALFAADLNYEQEVDKLVRYIKFCSKW